MPIPGYNDTLTTDAGIYAVDTHEDEIVFPAGQSIVSLDRYTGEKRWEQFFEDEGFNNSLSIAEGIIYTGALTGNVLALRADNGEMLWKQRTPGSITSQLVVQEERVHFCNNGGGQIWVLDAENGRVIWHGFPPEYNQGDRYATYLSPLAVGEGYMVNVGAKKVYALTVP